jgi:hypothetical protein
VVESDDPVVPPAGLASEEEPRSSVLFAVDAASPAEDPPSEPSRAELEPSLLDDESLLDRARARLALDRSFLAQPEPLKCTDGVETALRIVPSRPQAGQNRGPSASIRWITSMRFLQDAQT